MMKINIGFVILHYLTVEDTIECIESIKENIDTENYKIIVVDNASPNGTGKVLEKKYINDSKICVIINEYNMGFARGNNVGYEFLKNNYKCDYIAMMNNDVVLKEKQLYKKLNLSFTSNSFAVAGPKIITADGKENSNPMKPIQYSKRIIRKKIKSVNIQLALNYVGIYDIMNRIRNKIKKNDNTISNEKYITGIKLHGACLFFSKIYINTYNGLDNRTFLYLEEDILYEHMKNDNMMMLYIPDIVIYHKEDSATNAMISVGRSKRNFVLKNHLKSLYVLLDVVKE